MTAVVRGHLLLLGFFRDIKELFLVTPTTSDLVSVIITLRGE